MSGKKVETFRFAISRMLRFLDVFGYAIFYRNNIFERLKIWKWLTNPEQIDKIKWTICHSLHRFIRSEDILYMLDILFILLQRNRSNTCLYQLLQSLQYFIFIFHCSYKEAITCQQLYLPQHLFLRQNRSYFMYFNHIFIRIFLSVIIKKRDYFYWNSLIYLVCWFRLMSLKSFL